MSNSYLEAPRLLERAPALPPKTLRFLPIGGLGEIGMNMSVLEYEGKLLVIDAGQTLPDESMPGVDVVIPDVEPLLKRKDDIVGIVITHGHEDHIGALPHILPRLNVPVYAPRLASELIRAKMSEVKPAPKYRLTVTRAGDPIELGPFRVEYISVTHSTPDTYALGIETPIGAVVWSGDFKIDPNGLGESHFDAHAFARWGSREVLALFCDSTNAPNEGVSGHEIDLIDSFDLIMAESQDRALFVSTFSSSLHRMQTLIDLAAIHDRKVALAGRSVSRNAEIAQRLGILKVPKGMIVEPGDLGKLPRGRQLVICSGCQGEPAAALSRLSLDDHRKFSVKRGDTVIISGRIIPGNERPIYRMVNHFYRRGAKVLTERDAKVHVSGHAYRQEIKQLLGLVKPRHLVPIHGELRHLMAAQSIGRDMRIPAGNIHLVDRGDLLDISRNGVSLAGRISVGKVMVDGRDPEGLDDAVVRDRKHLAEDGMIVVFLAIDASEGKIANSPEIATRGFIQVEDNEKALEDLRRVVRKAFEGLDRESRGEAEVVRDAIRREVRRYVVKEYDRHPMILPTIIEL